jgi:hypothetical protein
MSVVVSRSLTENVDTWNFFSVGGLWTSGRDAKNGKTFGLSIVEEVFIARIPDIKALKQIERAIKALNINYKQFPAPTQPCRYRKHFDKDSVLCQK